MAERKKKSWRSLVHLEREFFCLIARKLNLIISWSGNESSNFLMRETSNESMKKRGRRRVKRRKKEKKKKKSSLLQTQILLSKTHLSFILLSLSLLVDTFSFNFSNFFRFSKIFFLLLKEFLLIFSSSSSLVPGVFLFCWVPFFTCNIMDAICIKLDKPESCRVSTNAFLLTTWLGYLNSIVNPVIYTIFNPEFRKAFKKILGIK